MLCELFKDKASSTVATDKVKMYGYFHIVKTNIHIVNYKHFGVLICLYNVH